MFNRIAAIALILLCTSVAWMILAGSIWSRTAESDDKLKPNVSLTWGSPQEQVQPFVTLDTATPLAAPPIRLDAESSRVNANLALEYRRKGLLWYSDLAEEYANKAVHNTESALEDLSLDAFDAAFACFAGKES